MTVDEDFGDYRTTPALIAGLRRGEEAALQVVVRARKAMQATDCGSTRAASPEPTPRLSISQLFCGIKPMYDEAHVSHSERMSRIADLLEAAWKCQTGVS